MCVHNKDNQKYSKLFSNFIFHQTCNNNTGLIKYCFEKKSYIKPKKFDHNLCFKAVLDVKKITSRLTKRKKKSNEQMSSFKLFMLRFSGLGLWLWLGVWIHRRFLRFLFRWGSLGVIFLFFTTGFWRWGFAIWPRFRRAVCLGFWFPRVRFGGGCGAP